MLVKIIVVNVLFFLMKEVVEGVYFLDGKLYFNEEYIMFVDELGIFGSYNIENVFVVICVVKLKNVLNV